jgi:GTP-binding protein EngB required for normal cell division
MSGLLGQQRRTKDAIVTQLAALAALARDAGMTTLASDIEVARIPKVQNERFHLVVLGEFNHGKSTFVNALLGEEVLPAGITPTTAAINHVVWADVPRAEARLIDGSALRIEPTAIADWVTVAGSRSHDVRYVEVGYPADILRNNVVLVDTPGVNDLNEQRADITYGYVPRADAVIFLLDAGQALKDSEREFLASRVFERTRERLIFVLGKIDLLSDKERDDVLAYAREGLAQLVDDPVIYAVSARRHLHGDAEASGMKALLDYLARFLDTDRATLVLDNAAADGARTAAYLQQNLGVKLRAYDLDLAELEERVAKVKQQLDTSKKNLDELHGRITAECAAVKSQVNLDLDQFARTFVRVLPEQVDEVDADDVRTYLAAFIEDRFRAFAELEGDKIASMLEHLAEEVIAVTNENVKDASAAVANRLAPDDTAVAIDIDSFKYDLAIYSVGALGTGVFLFVNSVAGGLLTLAAPILAIVLKSKIAGDIREQAKERAPEAIMRACDAIRPHFDRCVDDFGNRLSEFVTSAGTALYRGITEILDRTVAERRDKQGQLAPLRTAVSEQAAAVAEIRRALNVARTQVWNTGG